MATRVIEAFTSNVLTSKEQWSNGTQAGDPASGYVKTDGAGAVLTQRALTSAELTQLAAQDTAATTNTNQATLQQQAQTALAANRNDQTQDATLQSGAATINGTAGPFNLTQCTTFIKQLATAVSTNAGNDINTKKELNALIRLVLQQFDATN